MKPIFLAVALTLAAAPAFAQMKLTGSRAIDYGGVTIPASQAISPAGHDYMAFRPACWQLAPQINPGTGLVDWTIQMPDGKVNVLWTLDNLPTERAYVELQAAGICKYGSPADGVIAVPIIYTSQLPEDRIATPTAAATGILAAVPTATASRFRGIRGLLAGGFAAAGLAVIGWQFAKDRGKQQQPNPPATRNDNDPFGHI